jgi:hypothetical protein
MERTDSKKRRHYYTEQGKLFNTKLNYVEWLEHPWSSYQLASWYRWYGSGYKYSQRREQWWATSIILKHKNCPKTIRDKYAKKCFYKRIAAMLQRHCRADYIAKALQDRDRRVRVAAICGLWQVADYHLLTQLQPIIEDQFKHDRSYNTIKQELQQVVINLDKTQLWAENITIALLEDNTKIRRIAQKLCQRQTNLNQQQWYQVLCTKEKKIKI